MSTDLNYKIKKINWKIGKHVKILIPSTKMDIKKIHHSNTI